MKANQNGVYCLLREEEIVYVGKSNSCMRNRISSHISSTKDFDTAVQVVIDTKANALVLELLLINLLKPEYNQLQKATDELTIQIRLPKGTIVESEEYYVDRGNRLLFQEDCRMSLPGIAHTKLLGLLQDYTHLDQYSSYNIATTHRRSYFRTITAFHNYAVKGFKHQAKIAKAFECSANRLGELKRAYLQGGMPKQDLLKLLDNIMNERISISSVAELVREIG